MLRRRHLLGIVAAAVASPVFRRPAWATPADDTLRVTWLDALDTLDPYATPLRTGVMLAHDVYDGLVHRDPETLQIRPLLARTWRLAPDRLSLDFTLQGGVRFHNGSLFGPDDVIATVARAMRPDVAVPSNYEWLAGAERTDDGVRLHLAHPFPPVFEYLAMILPMLPADGATGAGTGPYLASLDADRTVRLLRNEGYAPGPKSRPAIARVEIRQRPDDSTGGFDDLEAGRADWIWQLTPAQFARGAVATGWQSVRAESMRIGYLQFDAAGRSEPNGPITRPEVRAAIVRAVDRSALAAMVVAGGGRVPPGPCYPTQFGCDGTVGSLPAFDPAAARALLAANGFGGGFATELVTYLRPDIVAFVTDALAAVGVRANVVRLPAGEAMARARAGAAPLFLGSWGSWSINDVSAILPAFFGGGALDAARRPEISTLVRDGDQAATADARRAAYGKAIEMVARDALFMPLYIDGATYGVSRRLAFRAAADELPRFYRMAWK